MGVQFPLPTQEPDTASQIPALGDGDNYVRRPGLAPKQVPFSKGSEFTAMIARMVPEAPSAHDQYSVTMAQTQRNLGALGIDPDHEPANIYINDPDFAHGSAVTRVAAGKTSLVPSADVSLTTEQTTSQPEMAGFTPELRRRLTGVQSDFNKAQNGDLNANQLANLAQRELESTVYSHRDAVEEAVAALPNNGRNSVMNMSWGQSAQRLFDRGIAMSVTAPKGSVLNKETTALLGHEARYEFDGRKLVINPDDKEVLEKNMLPKFDDMLNSGEHKSNMSRARLALEASVKKGRAKGLLVVGAVGNEFDRASLIDRSHWAASTFNGVPGIISVGAVDLGDSGREDDKVAYFSNIGATVAAPGVGMPVGEPGNLGPNYGIPRPTSGTSSAAPHVTQLAAWGPVNAGRNVDQVASLLTDPRVLRDLEGERDGLGMIDPMRLGLVAKNPALTSGQLDEIQKLLSGRPSEAQYQKVLKKYFK